MFGFMKKGKVSEEEEKARSLPNHKKVQFEPLELTRVEPELDLDIKAVIDYRPANYYATKDEYLLCIFYYNDDYSEIFMQFEKRVNDVCKGKTKFWSVDKYFMRDVLRKFGQQLDIGE